MTAGGKLGHRLAVEHRQVKAGALGCELGRDLVVPLRAVGDQVRTNFYAGQRGVLLSELFKLLAETTGVPDEDQLDIGLRRFGCRRFGRDRLGWSFGSNGFSRSFGSNGFSGSWSSRSFGCGGRRGLGRSRGASCCKQAKQQERYHNGVEKSMFLHFLLIILQLLVSILYFRCRQIPRNLGPG